MTPKKCTDRRINLQEIFSADKDSFKELLWEVLQDVLEQEMTEAVGADKGNRRYHFSTGRWHADLRSELSGETWEK
jgi:hypothetical protein